ncbi:hypothetical protein FLGE108171_04495 [Flavobacterium gelidilacus]|uniref:hypothetical protein n=1 Tax=Flavobacterium gelidilacus TaxID=206041 RepID=UPI0012F9239E|nr:hypothetical protein [Flavobacterium gelidilacus]
MRLNILYFCFFMLFFTNIFSQKITITIQDSIEKQSLPYSSVSFFDGNGLFADENGKLIIDKKIIDSIKVGHVGYFSKIIKLSNIKDLVYLEKDTTLLKEVVVVYKRQESKGINVKPLIHNNVYNMYWSAMGQQYAFFIPNEIPNSFLKTLTFPIIKKDFDQLTGSGPLKKQNFKTFIKVEFFSKSGDFPDKRLYDFEQYAIINSENITDKFKLSLDEEIKIPTEGLFTLMTIYGKVDESDNLIIDTPYDLNIIDGEEKKFLKLILPDFPIVESPKGNLTYFRHVFTIDQKWYRIAKPMLYDKDKEYPFFNIGLGYTTVILK